MTNAYGQISMTVKDYLGVEAAVDPINFLVADTTTVAQLDTYANGVVTLLDAIIDGQITGWSVKINMELPSGIKTTPTVGNPIEQGALLNFSQDGSRYKYGLWIPSISNSKIVDGRLNLSDTDVAAFKNWLLNIHTTLQAVSKFLLTFGALVDAVLSFRKKRKLESKRSFEVPS